MTRAIQTILLAFTLIFATTARAESKFELTWLGHAAFKIRTPSGGVLLIDPWVLNPFNPKAVETFRGIDKADYLLISHGHANALGNADELIKKTGARLVVADKVERGLIYNKLFAKKNFLKRSLRTWDSIDLLDGEITITLVPAEHLASTEHKNDAKMRNNTAYAGAYGFIIEIVGGPTIYHTGDTKFIDEFEKIGQKHRIDIMLTALDEKFTMSAEDAADAVAAVRPRMVIPMRYEGAPQNVAAFETELKQIGSTAIFQTLKPGETLNY